MSSLLIVAEASPNWAEQLTAFSTLFAILAIVVAIWTINESKYAKANGWILELDKSFIDRSDLRKLFFNPAGKYDEANHELAAFVEYAADTMDFFLKHRFGVGSRIGRLNNLIPERLRFEPRGIDGIQISWQNEVFKWLDKSGPFREYLESNSATYREEDSALGRLFNEWKRRKLAAQPTGSSTPLVTDSTGTTKGT